MRRCSEVYATSHALNAKILQGQPEHRAPV